MSPLTHNIRPLVQCVQWVPPALSHVTASQFLLCRSGGDSRGGMCLPWRDGDTVTLPPQLPIVSGPSAIAPLPLSQGLLSS